MVDFHYKKSCGPWVGSGILGRNVFYKRVRFKRFKEMVLEYFGSFFFLFSEKSTNYGWIINPK